LASEHPVLLSKLLKRNAEAAIARSKIGIFRGLLEDISRFAKHRTDFTRMQTSTKGEQAKAV